jgi:hypothetical protein
VRAALVDKSLKRHVTITVSGPSTVHKQAHRALCPLSGK